MTELSRLLNLVIITSILQLWSAYLVKCDNTAQEWNNWTERRQTLLNEMCNDVRKLFLCVPLLIKDVTLLHAGSAGAKQVRMLAYSCILYTMKHVLSTSLVFRIDLFYFITLWLYLVFSEFIFFNMQSSVTNK